MTKLSAEENDGIHIERIIDIRACAKHGKGLGQACWNVLSPRGILKAICNDRAVAAGANGKITPYKQNEPNQKGYTR